MECKKKKTFYNFNLFVYLFTQYYFFTFAAKEEEEEEEEVLVVCFQAFPTSVTGRGQAKLLSLLLLLLFLL